MAMQFDDMQTAALLDALGLPADTQDPQLVVDTAIDLAAQIAGMDPTKPSTVAAAAKLNDMEVVDNDTLAALRRDAAEGRTVKAAAERARVDAAVDDAVSKGKITAGRRKHWVSLIAADPGMADVLASVPDETAIPLAEVGHGVAAEDAIADTGAWFH